MYIGTSRMECPSLLGTFKADFFVGMMVNYVL
jgi:hypothetical protein